MLEKLSQELRSKIQVRADGCWIWTGCRYQRGYGMVHVLDEAGERTTRAAHREVWEQLQGKLPPGRALLLDHRCRSRACVNPEHLEPVTALENLLRSPRTHAARNAAKLHCPRGHEYTPGNTRIARRSDGRTGRICRACHALRDTNAAAKRRRAERLAAAQAEQLALINT